MLMLNIWLKISKFYKMYNIVNKYSISKFTIGPDCLVHDYLFQSVKKFQCPEKNFIEICVHRNRFLIILKPGVLNAITYHR